MLSVCLGGNRFCEAILTVTERQEVDEGKSKSKRVPPWGGPTGTTSSRSHVHELRDKVKKKDKHSPILTHGANALTPRAIRQEQY